MNTTDILVDLEPEEALQLQLLARRAIRGVWNETGGRFDLPAHRALITAAEKLHALPKYGRHGFQGIQVFRNARRVQIDQCEICGLAQADHERLHEQMGGAH